MDYLDYRKLKDFYTIQEICELFPISKELLHEKCDDYGIKPIRNEIGEGIFPKYDVRRLHNKLYYEERSHQQEWNPWA